MRVSDQLSPKGEMGGPPDAMAQTRLLGRDSAIQKLRSQIAAVGRCNCTVLIQGESGTGKEVVAREIHAVSPRAEKPFVVVDCTTLHGTLFESQLFGHAKGAFTGADHATLGLFRASETGTLFLDEIGELDLPIQAKLLRCLEERTILPLGETTPVPVDVRIIAATHRDLPALVSAGKFRDDLFFRLSVVRLAISPLRQRKADIALLANHFLAQYARVYGGPPKRLSEDAMAALEAYDWPGNVRELRNTIEHACVLATNARLTLSDLPAGIREQSVAPAKKRQKPLLPLRVVERRMIKRALLAADGNQTRAAELLEIERHRLSRMIRRYGLDHYARQRAYRRRPVEVSPT